MLCLGAQREYLLTIMKTSFSPTYVFVVCGISGCLSWAVKCTNHRESYRPEGCT